MTSEVAYEVLEEHLALRFNVRAVHVSVEQDDGKGQDEDSVGVVELLHHIRVTHTVPLTAKREIDERKNDCMTEGKTETRERAEKTRKEQE